MSTSSVKSVPASGGQKVTVALKQRPGDGATFPTPTAGGMEDVPGQPEADGTICNDAPHGVYGVRD